MFVTYYTQDRPERGKYLADTAFHAAHQGDAKLRKHIKYINQQPVLDLHITQITTAEMLATHIHWNFALLLCFTPSYDIDPRTISSTSNRLFSDSASSCFVQATNQHGKS